MTRKEIMSLSVGHQLDVTVDQQVMQKESVFYPDGQYSTHMDHAWLVHEHMVSDFDRLWDYSRELLDLLRIPGSKPMDTAMGILKELNPELICRAALLAVAGEDKAQ